MTVISAGFLEKFKEYIPETLSMDPIAEMVLDLRLTMERLKQIKQLRSIYEQVNRDMYEYRYRNKSNNWLKMHGQPMRRRRV